METSNRMGAPSDAQNGDGHYFISSTFTEKIFDDISRKIERHKDMILTQI